MSAVEQATIRDGYEGLYSTLSSFGKSTWSYNESEGDSVMESLSHGISETITESVSHTESHTISHTKGTNDTVGVSINAGGNFTKSSGTQYGYAKSSPTGVSRTGSAIGAISNLAAHIPTTAIAIPGIGEVLGIAKAAGVVGSVVGSAMQGSSTSNSIAESIGQSLGASVGIVGSYSHGKISSDTESDGMTNGTSSGTSKGTADTSTKGETHSSV